MRYFKGMITEKKVIIMYKKESTVWDKWRYFWVGLANTIDKEIIKAPIQSPEIVSSILSQRDKPKPAPIATVHTGHI
ncbi:MAG: hypothetical protein M1308_23335 [Actinobacteria bacterium]|nr:hypothetical protein [Actinomycetota bacterium]